MVMSWRHWSKRTAGMMVPNLREKIENKPALTSPQALTHMVPMRCALPITHSLLPEEILILMLVELKASVIFAVIKFGTPSLCPDEHGKNRIADRITPRTINYL